MVASLQWQAGAGAGLGRVSEAGGANTDKETSATAGDSGVSMGWWGQRDSWEKWDTGNSSWWPASLRTAGALFWSGEGEITLHGQEVKAAVQGLVQAVV